MDTDKNVNNAPKATGTDKQKSLLSVNALTVSISKKTVLDNLSFELKQPSITAIIGPNGAGKSTLLRTLAGDLNPSAGTMLFLSEALAKWNKKELAQRLSVLPQVSQLNFPFLVEDVVALSRMPHATGKKFDTSVVEQVLDRMDLLVLRDKPYTHLSGGEKQRVHIARVIAQTISDDVHRTRLLLLDEPTSALDIEHQHSLMCWLKELKNNTCSTLMVMHDFNLAAQYADTLISISDGRIAAVGPPQDVLTPDHLKHVFNVRATVIEHPVTRRPVVLAH